MEGEGLGDLVMCGTVNVVRQRVDTKQVVPNEEFRILFMNCLSQGLETRSSVGEAASISFIVYDARVVRRQTGNITGFSPRPV